MVVSDQERKVLDQGLKFVPAPEAVDREGLTEAARKVVRKAKLAYFFHNKRKRKRIPFEAKSDWEPDPDLLPPDLIKGLRHITRATKRVELTTPQPNVTKQQRRNISRLKNNKDIVIKPADKGSAIVIQNREDYVWEANRQLSNPKHYVRLEHPIYSTTAGWYQGILDDLLDEGYIQPRQWQYLSPPAEMRPRRFYMLPKIHKDPAKWSKPHLIPPGRPVISDCSSESYHIAEYIDYWLQPLATSHEAYLKDTNDVLDKLGKLKIPKDALIVTADVDAMYTNIEHEQGIAAVAQALRDNPNPERPPDEVILKLLEWGLTRNDFEFDGEFYLQICGTAMGKKFSPSYANIFMAQWEKRVLAQAEYKPLIYKRYLDDIFMIWTHGRDKLQSFLDFLNSDNPCIKLKAEISETSVDFLDLTIFKGTRFQREGILDTKVYHKPTDTMQLLHKASYHPKHTFAGIIKSQVLRYHRISTNPEDFHASCHQLFEALKPRGYSERFLRDIKSRTLQEIRDPTAKAARTHLKESARILKKGPAGSSAPCGSSLCKLCPYVESQSSITSRTTGKEFNLPEKLNCGSEGVVYVIQCKHCHIQYVGQTSLSLRARFNAYRGSLNRKDETPVINHFMVCNPDPEDYMAGMRITPIAQVHAPDTNEVINTLLDLEQSWITTLGTVLPQGLNLKEQVEPPMLPMVVPYSETAVDWAKQIREIWRQHIRPKFHREIPFRLIPAYSKNQSLKDLFCKAKLPATHTDKDTLNHSYAQDDLGNLVALAEDS